MSKKDAPTAVRVARWTAAAAAITALGTVGNTFIEKRPWFLEHENKPAIAVVKKVEMGVPKVEKYEAPTVHFRMPADSSYIEKFSEDASGLSATAVASPPPPPVGITMSAAPDMGWYANALTWIEYKPISFWILASSAILIGGYFIVEYLHRKNKT